MRVVIVGPAGRRQRLRARLPPGIEVIAEAPTLDAGQRLGEPVDAIMLTPVERDTLPLVEALTRREVEVLELLADGLANKAIAAQLGVSDETVKFHLSSIFGKLGASNRTDAVRQALRRGLVPL